MKKVVLILAGLLFVVVVALASIPLFVDVDQYRPMITAEANKRINGKLELGKLKLSLWGAIKIHAESIKVSVNGFPEPLLDTKFFHLELPFASVLSGHPEVIAVLDTPKISILKNANGKMNAMELVPTAAAPALAAPTPPVATAPATPAGPTKLPAIVVGASIGLRILNGNLSYADRVSKAEYKVEGLDLNARNLGLGRKMNIDIKAPLKGKMPTMSFEGPINVALELTPVLSGSVVKSAKGTLSLDATGLAVALTSGAFQKTKTTALTLKARFDGDEKETVLQDLEFRFFDYVIHGKGRVTTQPVTAKMEINTDTIRLDKLSELVPMLAAYDLKGAVNLNTSVDATDKDFKINGDLKLTDGSAMVKGVLKEPLKFQVQAGFSENSLNLVRVAVAGPDSDLNLQGTIKNFMAPQIQMKLTGTSVNVDKLVVADKGAGTGAPAGTPAAAVKPVPTDDVNPLAELAKNPILMKMVLNFNANVGKFIVMGAPFEQVNLAANMQNLDLKVTNASLKTFGGSVNTTGEFDLKSAGFNYHSQGDVAKISGKDALTAYFPKFKNTLEGIFNAKWNVSGAAFPSSVRMKSIKGNAKLVATDGALKSIDFQSEINSAIQKAPFLKNKTPLQLDDGFKSFTADINFVNGDVKIDPIDMQPRNRGFVIKGKSTIHESLTQETFMDIYDPQKILPQEISQGPTKPSLAFHLTGPLSGPQTDWGYTIQKLASGAGTTAVKSLIQKALGGAIPGGAPAGGANSSGNDAVKNLGDQIKKKFKLF